MGKSSNVIVAWDAKEYIQHDKHAGWYVGLVLIGLIMSGVAIWLAQWTFLALVVISVAALIVYSVRPPRTLHYSLDDQGLTEGAATYKFEDYKSFGVLKEGTHFSIVMIPRKRLSPQVKVYFPEKEGEKIVDVFGGRLPMEDVKLDFLDKIVNFLRI